MARGRSKGKRAGLRLLDSHHPSLRIQCEQNGQVLESVGANQAPHLLMPHIVIRSDDAKLQRHAGIRAVGNIPQTQSVGGVGSQDDKAAWVETSFFAEVEYRDITSEGLLRQSSFKGLTKRG